MIRADLVPGAMFPDLGLPDHAGRARVLSDLGGDDPLLLQFYRGWWCPKEQAFFRRLIELQNDAEVAYTRFVSVSVDESTVQAAFRAGIGARWTFLSDIERRYVDDLGLVESTDTRNRPYLPMVFVLRPDLAIQSVYNGYYFWGRPTMDELRLDFREISELIRPDWALPES